MVATVVASVVASPPPVFVHFDLRPPPKVFSGPQLRTIWGVTRLRNINNILLMVEVNCGMCAVGSGEVRPEEVDSQFAIQTMSSIGYFSLVIKQTSPGTWSLDISESQWQ